MREITLIKIEFLIIGMFIAFLIDKIKLYKIGKLMYLIRGGKVSYGLKIDDKRLANAHRFNKVVLEMEEVDEKTIIQNFLEELGRSKDNN